MAISCASAGNCVAGGNYTDSGELHGFVANETNGVWSSAAKLPGIETLTTKLSQVATISCPAIGRCTLTGRYQLSGQNFGEFVADEINGVWGNVQAMPGSNALGIVSVGSNYLSCPTAGNCALSGYYTDGGHKQQSYVDAEVNGTWGSVEELPGTAALNVGGDAEVVGVSCPSPGNCAVSGHYSDNTGKYQDFVDDQVNGTWGTAQEVPGMSTLNTGGDADSEAISCGSVGNCVETGYLKNNGHRQAYEAAEVSGTWGVATILPGSVALNEGQDARALVISCPSSGNCAVSGYYTDSVGNVQIFVDNEVNGVWGTTEAVPALISMNANGDAWTNALTCTSAGNCLVDGYYDDSSGNYQAFIAAESNGVWGSAFQVPGSAAANAGGDAEGGGLSGVRLGVTALSRGTMSILRERNAHSSVLIRRRTPPRTWWDRRGTAAQR